MNLGLLPWSDVSVITLYCDAVVNYADRRGVCFVIVVVKKWVLKK